MGRDAPDDETTAFVECEATERDGGIKATSGLLSVGDDSLMPAEMAHDLRQQLMSGEMDVVVSDEVRAELADMGIDAEDFRAMLIDATGKSQS